MKHNSIKTKKNRRLLSKAVAIIGLAALTITGCGNTNTANDSSPKAASSDAKTSKLTKVNFGVITNSPTHWISILDKDTGIFAKHGIELVSTEFSMGINAVDSMALGQVDFTSTADYAGVNRIGNTTDKTNFRYLAETCSGNTGDLYVNPKIIKKPSDLEGKTVITIAGTVYDYYYAKLFETYKLDKAKIKIATVSSASEAAAIAEGGGDGVAFWSSAGSGAGQQLEQAGWKTLVSLKDIGLSLHQYLNGSSDFVEKNPSVTEEFLKAYEESLEYIYSHLDETAKIIRKQTGLDEDLYKSTFQDTYELTFSQESYEALQDINTWCRSNGNYTADYDVADYILSDPLKAAYPDKVTLKK